MAWVLVGVDDGTLLTDSLVTTNWLAHARVNDRDVFRIGRNRDRLVAEWIGLARLEVDRDGANPSFTSVAGADPILLKKIELGVCRALLRHVNGGLALHAAAVESGGNALAFGGDSGAGKSTLAFSLASAPGYAFALLSDDCLCIDGRDALPSEAVAWLAPPDGGEKSPRSPPRVAVHRAPLRAVLTLAYGTDFALRRLRGSQAASALARAMIRFVIDEPQVHRADMDRIADLAHEIAVFELTRPRGLQHVAATLSRVRDVSDALR